MSAKSRPEFFAHALNNAMNGLGTDDWALIRIIVTRCEIDLENIKDKYKELYEKDLIEQVKVSLGNLNFKLLCIFKKFNFS